MAISQFPLYGILGSIALLISGFMSIAYNKSIANAFIAIFNDFNDVVFPSVNKVRKGIGFWYHFLRVSSVLIGIFGLTVALLILRKFIGFI